MDSLIANHLDVVEEALDCAKRHNSLVQAIRRAETPE